MAQTNNKRDDGSTVCAYATGALVRVTAADPRPNARGQVGRFQCLVPNELPTAQPDLLVDFGLRGSLLFKAEHLEAFAATTDSAPRTWRSRHARRCDAAIARFSSERVI